MRDGSVLWQQLTRRQVAEAAARGDAVLLLPVGAIEQHGPHLPLDTDSGAALAVCVRVAEQVQDAPVLVLPPVWWGLSPYWMAYPGTLTLRPETLSAVVEDVCRSVERLGFRRVVIVNGHAGNAGLLQGVAASVSTATFRVAALSYWALASDALRDASERDSGLIGHAGELETSIALHLWPDRVDLGAVDPSQATPIPLARRAGVAHLAGVYEPPNPLQDAPGGIYGQPLAASAEKGERVLRAVVERLADFARGFRTGAAGAAGATGATLAAPADGLTLTRESAV